MNKIIRCLKIIMASLVISSCAVLNESSISSTSSFNNQKITSIEIVNEDENRKLYTELKNNVEAYDNKISTVNQFKYVFEQKILVSQEFTVNTSESSIEYNFRKDPFYYVEYLPVEEKYNNILIEEDGKLFQYLIDYSGTNIVRNRLTLYKDYIGDLLSVGSVEIPSLELKENLDLSKNLFVKKTQNNYSYYCYFEDLDNELDISVINLALLGLDIDENEKNKFIIEINYNIDNNNGSAIRTLTFDFDMIFNGTSMHVDYSYSFNFDINGFREENFDDKNKYFCSLPCTLEDAVTTMDLFKAHKVISKTPSFLKGNLNKGLYKVNITNSPYNTKIKIYNHSYQLVDQKMLDIEDYYTESSYPKYIYIPSDGIYYIYVESYCDGNAYNFNLEQLEYVSDYSDTPIEINNNETITFNPKGYLDMQYYNFKSDKKGYMEFIIETENDFLISYYSYDNYIKSYESTKYPNYIEKVPVNIGDNTLLVQSKKTEEHKFKVLFTPFDELYSKNINNPTKLNPNEKIEMYYGYGESRYFLIDSNEEQVISIVYDENSSYAYLMDINTNEIIGNSYQTKFSVKEGEYLLVFSSNNHLVNYSSFYYELLEE